MGLQIRVRHALGVRVMELPNRTVEEPIVVGRSSSAQVQVPSVTVTPKHCVLFVHEGHWAVQDLGGGTFVNGQPLQGAAFLQIGDTIQVGHDGGAPVIEIDPAAAAEGRTGYAGSGLPEAAPAVAVPGYPASQTAYEQQAYVPPGYPPRGYAQPRQVADPVSASHHAAAQPSQGYEGDDVTGSGDEVAFTPSTPTYSSYRRPAKRGNGGMVAVMVIATVLIGGVIAYVIYQNKNKPPVVQKQPDVVIIKPSTQKKPTVLFDGLGTADTTLDNIGTKNGKTPVTKPAAPGVMPAGAAVIDPRTAKQDDLASAERTPRPVEPERSSDVSKEASKTPDGAMDPIRKPTADASEPGMDPIRKPAASGEEGIDPVRKPAATPAGPDAETMDPATAASWEAIQQLADLAGKESYAVLRFEDFRRQNPGKYDKQIDEFIDKKMDRIWWERIDQLFRQIDTLQTTMDKTRLEIYDENNPEVKKQKIESVTKMKSELEQATKTLRDTMAYSESKPPNLQSSAELAALAQTRDKLKYEGWKKSTLYYIKSNQGRLQWMNER